MRRNTRRKLAATGLTLVLAMGGGLAQASVADAADRSSPRQSAPVQVPGFSAAGNYLIYQSNGAVVNINLVQDRTGRLYGSATHSRYVGTVTQGQVTGYNIFFIISWSHGARGRYTGSLGPDRRLSGVTIDLAHPSSQASWFTIRTF